MKTYPLFEILCTLALTALLTAHIHLAQRPDPTVRKAPGSPQSPAEPDRYFNIETANFESNSVLTRGR